MDKEKTALEIVAIELGKAKGKHNDFPADTHGGAVIISEEYAELNVAMMKFLQGVNDRHNRMNLIEEAAQVAVTAIRFVEGMLNDAE